MSALEPAASVGHERRDISPGPVVWWIIGIFVLLALSAGAMWLLLGRYDTVLSRESPPASPLAGYGPTEPPEPRLQVDPWGDIGRLRAAEHAQLEGYGWVDQDAGTVHIPIDRAMQLLSERRRGATP